MDLQKIAKVLALAASDNEAEALHALRTAKRLLEAEGGDFVELANRVAGDDGVGRAALENAVFDMRNEIRDLRCENERLKQARGLPSAAVPSSMFDAARAAGDVIRLRAELAELHEVLDHDRAQLRHVLANEAALHHALQDALAEAAHAKAQLSDGDSRRMRLEVENRRLLHANHALTVELEEARAAAPPAFVPEAAAEKKPRVRRAHGAIGQYALF
ncbi:MAG: metalloendopeptidase [Bacteroidota bacterium]